jgi:hypothetical protein
MVPSMLSEQVVQAQIAERRREVAALQRGILAARAVKQARRDSDRPVPKPATRIPAPAGLR